MESASLAWFETNLGVRIPIQGTCSIGRAKSNSIAIPSERVSRRHALVHLHGDGEYLLLDLGSSNGTVVNGRRIEHMTVLHDGDLVELGAWKLLFRRSTGISEESGLLVEEPALAAAATPCWLLVAATENANAAKYESSVDESFKTVMSWALQSEQIIQRSGGKISRQSGEEIFAYWQAEELDMATTQRVLDTVLGLQSLQAKNSGRFRIALHHGRVLVEVARPQAPASLEGHGVTLAFHLQRLVWMFPVTLLLSRAAAKALDPLVTAKALDLGDVSATAQPLFTL